MQSYNIDIVEEDLGQRVDKVLAMRIDDLSRARIQALMAGDMVYQNGILFHNASYRVNDGETYEVKVPPPIEADPVAQDIPLDIVYEDNDLLVINKAPGMVVHPGAGNPDGTLVNALLAYCGDELSGIGGVKRPGIVHRLDKNTSGLMMVAKNDIAHRSLTEQLSSRRLKRVYLALVWGYLKEREGTIETNIGRSRANRQKMAVMQAGGKEAITDFRVVEQFGITASLVECRLRTGRTHQIRVHMAHIQNWMIGDPVYSRPSPRRHLKPDSSISLAAKEAIITFQRQALHAQGISFVHPVTDELMSFNVDLPKDLAQLIKTIKDV